MYKRQVTDRVHREANKGYLYSFNSDSLKVENKYKMPYRAFSLAINQDKHQLYIGHTQSASLRISMFDTPTGKLVRTSAVSYTHLDVYKRQVMLTCSTRSISP